MRHNSCIPSLCLLTWWVPLVVAFHLSFLWPETLTLAPLSLTDGEDHWGASVGCVSGQSSYDHGGHFPASGAFDQQGKGTVEIIGAQLDFALVSVLMCWCTCRDGFTLILKETCSSFCQLAAQRGRSSVFSCLPGWLAASDSRLDWATSGGSHWVTA